MKAATIRVRGVVQGVGLRPRIWQLATAAGLDGEVVNDPDGVLITIQGHAAQLDAFPERLRDAAPPLCLIDEIETRPAPVCQRRLGFHIKNSRTGEAETGIRADAAPCRDCLAEVQDPDNRRYRYPFTNCTHCGPRFSIVTAIPWDRQRSTMASFTQCALCQAEYENPGDRRFHAQPNACPACGPVAWYETADGSRIDGDPIDACLERLLRGEIVAIKGVGGFHLACDAQNNAAIERLRQRKRRPHKPLALMAGTLSMVRQYALCSDSEAAALVNPAAPILLLQARPKGCGDGKAANQLDAAIAPGLDTLGFMLPSSPLHALLMSGLDRPLVMSSGNRAGNPPCIDNGAARLALADIADGFLLHDRTIANRIDDSLLRMIDGKLQPLRRARGYAPMPIALPAGLCAKRPLLAFGAELKHTFCIVRRNKAMLSQHIGDLENAPTLADLERNLSLWSALFQHEVYDVALDTHPEYLSAKLARATFDKQPGKQVLTEVAHHHAHFAACLADNSIAASAADNLGIVLDGLGMGSDGELWGGEFLLGGLAQSRRIGALRAVALPGGLQAIRQPWRNLLARVRGSVAFDEFRSTCSGHPLCQALESQPVRSIELLLDKALNCPPCSSAGRLFDAVAAALGLCFDVQSFEGQAAMQLETLAMRGARLDNEAYTFRWLSADDAESIPRLDDTPMWVELFADLSCDIAPEVIAHRFHCGFADAVAGFAMALTDRYAISRMVLSGGVMQNRVFVERLVNGLRSRSIEVLQHQQVPANDGGIAFGQAVSALSQAAAETTCNPDSDIACLDRGGSTTGCN